MQISHPCLIRKKGFPRHKKNPNSTFKPSTWINHKEFLVQIKFILILDVWWYNKRALVELRGPPYFKTPIPPSNLQISNTHKEIWLQIEIMLILDVWWFKILAPISKSKNPPWNPQIWNTHKEIWPQIEIMLILDL